MTESELKQLLDSQRFYQNVELAEMISNAEEMGKHRLSDDDLAQVSAAGDGPQMPDPLAPPIVKETLR